MKKFLFSSSTTRGAILGIVLWFLIIGAVSSIAPSLSEVTTNEQEEFLPVGAESVAALNLRTEKFPAADGIPALVVFQSDDSIELNQAIERFTEIIRSENVPDSIISILSPSESVAAQQSLISSDGSTAMVIATLGGNPSEPEFSAAVDWLSDQASQTGGNVQIDTAVTGPAGIISDAVKVFESIDIRVTLATVGLVFVLLLIIYRSPVLAIVPLVVLGSALTLAQSFAALLSQQFDLPLNGQVTAIMSVLVFGAGTNYALFIVSRYREELVLDNNKWSAMRVTMSNIGPSIAGSAGTTIVAMLALTFASFGSFRSLGPMLAIAIFVVLLSGLFVMPAVIALFGKWAFWPRPLIQQSSVKTDGIWYGVGRLVSRKPRMIFGITMIGIVIATLPSWTIIPSFNFIDGFPDDAESKRGYVLLADSFPEGQLAPTEIFIETSDSAITDRLEAVEEFSATIAGTPGIYRVSGPTRPFGVTMEPVEAMKFGAARFISADGSTARVEVLMEGDPYSRDSLDLVQEMRLLADASEFGDTNGARVLIGGESAIQADTKASIDADIKWLAPVSLIAIFLVLVLLLKSIMAPIYLVFSVIVSFGATFGLSVLAFQQIFSHSGVAYANGVWMFIFLVALGADYNIFVMSRIREATKKEGFRDGITTAVGRTGGVVTSAGIILAGTFAVLTTLPLRDIFQLGFAVMLGVLIDTFIVRALLVPSMAAILGELSWWPRKHSRNTDIPEVYHDTTPAGVTLALDGSDS
ncbi:MAG: MMPL family transporter [Dehalococcoidia bacterium]|nr:MMPL family transporter [Dehalococcoidia bacterium]